MKKITLIASALLVVSSLIASPVLKADKLNQWQQKQMENVAVQELKAVMPLDAKVKKAPAALNAISNVVVGSQTGYGDAAFMWQTEGVATYFLFTLYNASMNKALEAGYYGASQFAVTGQTNVYAWSLADLAYNGTDKQLSALPAGKWYVSVTGYIAQNGSAVLAEEEAVSALFEIVSYDVTGFTAVLNAEKNKLSVNFDVLSLPANHFYGVKITQGTTTLFNNFSTYTMPELPYAFDVEEGKSYNIMIVPLEIYNGTNYIACDNYVDTIITVGTNPLTPVDLSAMVSGDTVFLQWDAVEASAYYWVDIYDSEGNLISLKQSYTQNKSYTAILAPDEYTWSVTAMTLEGSYLYEASAAVFGPEFKTEDIVAPEISKVVVSDITADAAKVTFKAVDRWTLASELQISIMDANWVEIAYPELQKDGTFAAEITAVPGDGDYEPLKPDTKYEFLIMVFDNAWNMASYNFEFTTLSDTNTALENLTAIGVVYEQGRIVNANGELLRVYNAAGALVAESVHNIDMNGFAAGVYMVCAQQGTLKIVK